MRLHSVASGLHGKPGRSPTTTAASLGREAILNDTRTLDESKTGEASGIFYGKRGLALASAPFLGGDFPDFGREAAGDIVAVFGADQAHALFFGDAAGGGVADGFGCAQDGEIERVEPEIGDRFAGLGHQALTLPGSAEPETSIFIFFFAQINAADNLVGIGFEAQRPMPRFAAFFRRKRHVANEVKGPVSWIGPGHMRCQVANDFPVRKENLDLFGVPEVERAQQKPRCFERRCHRVCLGDSNPENRVFVAIHNSKMKPKGS